MFYRLPWIILDQLNMSESEYDGDHDDLVDTPETSVSINFNKLEKGIQGIQRSLDSILSMAMLINSAIIFGGLITVAHVINQTYHNN